MYVKMCAFQLENDDEERDIVPQKRQGGNARRGGGGGAALRRGGGGGSGAGGGGTGARNTGTRTRNEHLFDGIFEFEYSQNVALPTAWATNRQSHVTGAFVGAEAAVDPVCSRVTDCLL